MKQRTVWLFVFALGALVTVGFGVRFWRAREGEFLRKMQKPAHFLLVDTEGRVFDSQKSPQRRLQLYIFLPNGLRPSDVTSLSAFGTDFRARWQDAMEGFWVSRINKDFLLNTVRASHWQGRVLLDPSGTTGRIFGFWKNITEDDGWHYVLLEGSTQQLVGRWDSAEPLTVAQLAERFKP